MTSKSPEIAIGIRNKPQIVSLFDLSTTYHYKNCIKDRTETDSISRVVSPIIERMSSHFDDENWIDLYEETNKRPCEYFSDDWRVIPSGRTAIMLHDDIPEWILKVYNFKPGRGNHMANTLRVPMACCIQGVIEENHLDDMVVPRKGLIPIYDRKKMAELETTGRINERTVNEAFLVVVEKMDLFPKEKKTEHLRSLSENQQESLASQVCMIPENTGLGDYTWRNLELTADGKKVVVLDTEPLYGALLVDRTNDSFERNRTFLRHYTLDRCAKEGLKQLHRSSQQNDLVIFENTAQKFLERYN